MEIIRQAIVRARTLSPARSGDSVKVGLLDGSDVSITPTQSPNQNGWRANEVELDCALLQSKRIVSYDGKDDRSRPYDILRTQVLQAMDAKAWKVLGVTSPTPKCGKTLTAINLAFSIARQAGRSVVLVDLDLQRPQIAASLGLKLVHEGILGVLKERVDLRNVALPVRAGGQQITVIPSATTRESAEFMAARSMNNLLQNLKTDHQIIILDLPPILSSDDVIALLPQIDCMLFTATVGRTRMSEIEDSIRHLEQSEIVRVVLNKATDANSNYYYY